MSYFLGSNCYYPLKLFHYYHCGGWNYLDWFSFPSFSTKLFCSFASRLLAWILSRVVGASIRFRFGGWKCIRDLVVEFKKVFSFASVAGFILLLWLWLSKEVFLVPYFKLSSEKYCEAHTSGASLELPIRECLYGVISNVIY